MGSAYMGWMEDFGLIGVFCSLVLQKSCLRRFCCTYFKCRYFNQRAVVFFYFLVCFKEEQGVKKWNRLLDPKLKRNDEGEEGEKLKRHRVGVARTC
jgi:hypothetical protein